MKDAKDINKENKTTFKKIKQMYLKLLTNIFIIDMINMNESKRYKNERNIRKFK